ncbi:hypothetical protein ACRWDD_26425, partial [Escherichia coli]
KQKKLIMLPSETMIWQPEFTDKTLSRKPGAVHICITSTLGTKGEGQRLICGNFESVQFPSSGLAVFNG